MKSVAIAMQFAPNVIEHILSGLNKMADKIRETVRKVKANKYQCSRFSERVDMIVGFLQKEKLTNSSNMSLKTALERFHKFLQRCLDFIKQFIKGGWFRRILHNHNYFQQFQELNEELGQHCQDLNLGLTFALYRMFAAENVEDAKHDLEEISEIVQSQQPLLSGNLSMKLQTNIPGTLKTNPTVRLQDQYYNHWQYSLPFFYRRKGHRNYFC